MAANGGFLGDNVMAWQLKPGLLGDDDGVGEYNTAVAHQLITSYGGDSWIGHRETTPDDDNYRRIDYLLAGREGERFAG